MKKKSYNPFKMWGSYVGAIISIFIIILFLNSNCESFDERKYTLFQKSPSVFVNGQTGEIGIAHSDFFLGYSFEFFGCSPNKFIDLPDFFTISLYGTLFYSFIIIILGFLIGWGIHSLIRRFKK